MKKDFSRPHNCLQKIIILLLLVQTRTSFQDNHSQTRFNVPGPRIIGGTQADLGDWSWQGVLLIEIQGLGDTASYLVTCGVSLLSSTWAITAAHCLYNDPVPNHYILSFGIVHLEDPRTNRQNSVAKEIYIHPSYEDNTLKNDIALIQLVNSINSTDYIAPVDLPFPEENVPEHVVCYATGFGRTDQYELGFSDYLMEVKLNVHSDATCLADEIGRYGYDPESMMCAGEDDGSKSACFRDSGGPLVCLDKESKWILAGLTSWGVREGEFKNCASYTVFTKVASYEDWFLSVTSGLVSQYSNSSRFDYNQDDGVTPIEKVPVDKPDGNWKGPDNEAISLVRSNCLFLWTSVFMLLIL